MADTETGQPDNLTLLEWSSNGGSAWTSLTGAHQLKLFPERVVVYADPNYEAGSPRIRGEIRTRYLDQVLQALSHTTKTGSETIAKIRATFSKKGGATSRVMTISNVLFAGKSELVFGNKQGLGDRGADDFHTIKFEIKLGSADENIDDHIDIVDVS